MNLHQAINSALSHILETDPKAILFGEDVSFGGVFRVTSGLHDRFGGDRVFNTPLSEAGIVGFGVGLATSGYTAIPEIQFGDYVFPAFDQIHSEASTYRYRSGGAKSFNSGQLVIRMPVGAVGHGGIWHSQSPEGHFMGVQGVKIVVPRSPTQAKGLLIAATRCNDPVMFMEPKILYRAAVEDVPVEEYTLPIGKAQVVKQGKDVTVVSYGAMMYVVEAAAKAAKERLGVDVEVVDLRTVHPWDKKTVVESVKKTGRCIVVHEASRSGGVGEGVAAEVQERCFLSLEAPVGRVTGWDIHMPLQYEPFVLPDVASESCGDEGGVDADVGQEYSIVSRRRSSSEEGVAGGNGWDERAGECRFLYPLCLTHSLEVHCLSTSWTCESATYPQDLTRSQQPPSRNGNKGAKKGTPSFSNELLSLIILLPCSGRSPFRAPKYMKLGKNQLNPAVLKVFAMSPKQIRASRDGSINSERKLRFGGWPSSRTIGPAHETG